MHAHAATRSVQVRGEWLYLGWVDDVALKAVVPDSMAAHPGVSWEFIATDESFAIEIRPSVDPGRYARLYVSESTEIFRVAFAGHETVDFAYELPDKLELLQEQIEEAVLTLHGPTQVLLDWAGDRIVRSAITHNPGGEAPPDFTMDWPFERLWWWLKGKRLRREVVRFPALSDLG